MDISNPQIRSLSTTIASKWNRLIEMSPQEIGFRFYKECSFFLNNLRTNCDNKPSLDKDLVKAFGLDWFYSSPNLSLENLRYYLENTVAPRFYFNPSQQNEYANLVKYHFPDWVEKACKRANQLCNHRFQLLGFDEINLGKEINWHRDPQTGYRWPQKHWSKINIHLPEPGADPKLIWELNRHQHLSWLGLAYSYTQNEYYAREYIRQIEDWIDQNPYAIGINWASSLEIAFRVINWFWALLFFIKSPSLNSNNILRIIKSLIQQLEAILENPSIYTSPNTHLIGEAFALYLGGVLLAEHKSAHLWRNFGIRFLSRELQKQFFKDGVHKEQSAYYHCYAVEFYLLATILAKKNQQTEVFDETVLIKACEYLTYICQPGGELSRFGDEDGGKVLMLGINTYRSPSDLLATAAVNYLRKDFKYCAGDYQEATLWLTGKESLEIFDNINARPPQNTSASFSDSGHVVFRSDWSNTANYLLFHCPTKTHLPGHMHADFLSFELASGGYSRLIDNGTYKYNGDPTIRNYYRGTSAHNTVRIDRQDQSIVSNEFKWQRQANAKLLKTIFSSVADYTSGEHDGYLSLSNPCLHRRAILFAKPDYFVIWDEFIGTGEHYYESFLHCGDALFGQISESSLYINYKDGRKLLIVPITNSQISADILPTSNNYTTGWYSRTYGKKESCFSLKLNWKTSTPNTMLTILFPYQTIPPVIEVYCLNVSNSLCARIRTADYEDIIIFSPAKGEFKHVFNLLSFSGEKLFLRIKDKVVVKSFAINANFIQYNNQLILNTFLSHHQFIWDEKK